MKVLLVAVEGERSGRLQVMLESLSYTVSCQSTSEGVSKRLQDEGFDLLCCLSKGYDQNLLALCREVEQLPQPSRCVCVWLISASDDFQMADSLSITNTAIFSRGEWQQLIAFVVRLQIRHKAMLSAKGTVLLVEDSMVTVYVVKSQLEAAGLTVLDFDTAEAAYEAFVKNDISLVVTDLMLLGDETGEDLIKKIRSDRNNQSIPIVVVSGDDDPELKLKLFQAGVSDFVSKPVLAEELKIRVCNLLRLESLQQEREVLRTGVDAFIDTDSLTGLANWRSLLASFTDFAQQYEKQGISMLRLSIAEVLANDSPYITRFGDALLELMQSTYQAFYLGGGEFVVLTTLTSEAAERELTQIVQAITSRIAVQGQQYVIHGGVSVWLGGEQDQLDALYHRAKAASSPVI